MFFLHILKFKSDCVCWVCSPAVFQMFVLHIIIIETVSRLLCSILYLKKKRSKLPNMFNIIHQDVHMNISIDLKIAYFFLCVFYFF